MAELTTLVSRLGLSNLQNVGKEKQHMWCKVLSVFERSFSLKTLSCSEGTQGKGYFLHIQFIYINT